MENDMKDGMSWREARKFAKIAARRPHPCQGIYRKNGSSPSRRFVGKKHKCKIPWGADKMQMLNHTDSMTTVKAIREYLANYTGKTSTSTFCKC